MKYIIGYLTCSKGWIFDLPLGQGVTPALRAGSMTCLKGRILDIQFNDAVFRGKVFVHYMEYMGYLTCPKSAGSLTCPQSRVSDLP